MKTLTPEIMASLSPKAHAFIALYAAAIRKCPEAYKAYVSEDPESAAWRLIDGLTEAEISRFIRDQKEENRLLKKHGF